MLIRLFHFVIKHLKAHLTHFKNSKRYKITNRIKNVLKTILEKHVKDCVLITLSFIFFRRSENGRVCKSKLLFCCSSRNKICYCIEYHEEYNWNGNNVKDINTLILQDADNLDAIGAIGIGRTFSYGGSHNIVMYDENVELNENNDYSESSGNDASTIHHFYHKLFKLKDNMNTLTAKKIAEYRTEFMKSFVKEFIDEWNEEKI